MDYRQEDPLWKKKRGITAMTYNIPHSGGRDVSELLSSRDDDGLYLRGKLAIGIGYGPFVVEIHHIPYAPDYVMYAQLTTNINRKAVILYGSYARAKRSSGLRNNIQLLLTREEAGFVLVDTHSDHERVKHSERAGQYIEVSRSKGVKRSWE